MSEGFVEPALFLVHAPPLSAAPHTPAPRKKSAARSPAEILGRASVWRAPCFPAVYLACSAVRLLAVEFKAERAASRMRFACAFVINAVRDDGTEEARLRAYLR